MEERIMLEQRRPSRTVPDGGPGGLGDIFAAAQRPDLVSVQHGVHGAMLPVAEMTVGEIRARFADHFDIDPRSQAQLDGRGVDNQTVVRAGQVLMFVRPSGEKGRGGR
jgi:hypothetical protein